MKRFALAVICLFASTAETANALKIFGTLSCGEWVQNRKLPAQSPARTASETWLAGYMSGMVVASEVDFLRSVDSSQIELWMDNYCNSHPLEVVPIGGQELALELKGRMVQKQP